MVEIVIRILAGMAAVLFGFAIAATPVLVVVGVFALMRGAAEDGKP